MTPSYEIATTIRGIPYVIVIYPWQEQVGKITVRYRSVLAVKSNPANRDSAEFWCGAWDGKRWCFAVTSLHVRNTVEMYCRKYNND